MTRALRTAPPMTDRRRSRAWVLFFAALFLLAAAAVTLEVGFSLHQQLTPAALERARALWDEKGPADYDLTYTVKRQDRSGERLLSSDNRHAEIVEVQVNGELLAPPLYPFHDLGPLFAQVRQPGGPEAPAEEVNLATAPQQSTVTYLVQVRHGHVVRALYDDQPVPASVAGSYDMPSLFAALGTYLERDAPAGLWRPFAVATFDRADGHLLHYVRSLMRTRERVEFNLVELRPVSAQAPSPQ
jgi:hypothetical protein